MHYWHRGWLVLLLAWPVWAMARVTIDPTTASTTVNWTGGDVVYDVSFCVQSIVEPNVNQGTTLIPYDAAVSIGGTGQAYALWAGGVGPGLPVTAEWTDLPTPATYTLLPNVKTSRVLAGVTNCPAPANARLRLRVTQANLVNAAGGSYTRAFTVAVTNAGGGRRSHSATVTFTINVPLIARISQINDINLGMWTGGDLVGSDSLCIYRNGPGLYTVTTSGNGGGPYVVSSGAAQVPYAVDWNDGAGFAPMTSGTPLTNRTNAWTAGDGCNGGANNNATVRVTVSEAALGSATVTGTYSGVLTILYSTQ